jgi:formiminoglutamase
MPVNHLPPATWTGRSDPEDGDQALRLHHLVKSDAPRALIGFASEAGVIRNKGRSGAKEGPATLRKALANLAAPANPIAFADLGDIEITGDDLEAGQSALADKICDALGSYNRLIVIGGGHETAFGSYTGLTQAFPQKRIGIVNLDAHLDIRLPGDNGPSSGTPFAQIRALDEKNFDYLCLGVSEESNTAALMDRARSWNVQTIADHALIEDRHSADLAIESMAQRNELIYLTIDLDVLPHSQAPGVSAPAARGVPLSTIEYLVRKVLDVCGKSACALPLADIVELSPPNDRQNITATTAALLIRQMLC